MERDVDGGPADFGVEISFESDEETPIEEAVAEEVAAHNEAEVVDSVDVVEDDDEYVIVKVRGVIRRMKKSDL
jgi:hypothetical protein